MSRVDDLSRHLFVDRQGLREVAQLVVGEAQLHQRSDISATKKYRTAMNGARKGDHNISHIDESAESQANMAIQTGRK